MTYLCETEDIVNKEKHILAFFVPEVLRDRESFKKLVKMRYNAMRYNVMNEGVLLYRVAIRCPRVCRGCHPNSYELLRQVK